VFLKNIELFGFKSFPERTQLEFQDGISAILGPNGCGKSNVVDAIRWVIGEQSTKSLRAARMEDVIFNGSEDRKALNIAEVTLTLLNNNGLLPLDIPEIAIRRRLYRSGESEYYINRRIVRLREIRELFFDTGIGKSAYSIIEQGKIDQVLSAKPEDKRYIFEEAAGITRYKVKAQEAERKLLRTDENMRQINIILSEVRRNYNSLKSQSEKTELYRQIRDSIFNLDRDVQLLNLKDFLANKDKKEARLKTVSSSREKLQKKVDVINKNMEGNIDLVNTMESKLIESQKKTYGIDLEKNNKDSQIKIIKEQINELHRKIREDDVRGQNTKTKLNNLHEESKQKNNSLTELIAETKDIKVNIEGFERDIELFSEKIAVNDKETTNNDREIAGLEKSIESLRVNLRQITDDIVTQMDRQLKETGYSYKDRRKIEDEIEELLGSMIIQIEGRKVLIDDLSRIGTDQREDSAKIIRSVGSLLKESIGKIRKLDELFGSYKKSTPSFIDEFLSPEGIITRKREIDSQLNQTHEGILNRRKANERIKEESKTLNKKIDDYRKTLEGLRVNQARTETRKLTLDEQIARLGGEISEQHVFLEQISEVISDTKSRIEKLQSRISILGEERSRLDSEGQELKETLSRLEKDIKEKNELLLAEEKQLKESMDRLLKLQAQLEGLQIDLAEVNTEVKNIYVNFNEKYSRDLTEFESRMFDIKEPTKDLRQQLTDRRDEQRKLGHVNLMAPEEFLEVKERFEFLKSQLEDLQKAKNDLRRITEQIQSESVELFLNTYKKIKQNFHLMFRRLFGGGRAELKLESPDDVLESGIEMLAQPPGKKLENIDLLSGGERALTGVALLFAVYLTKPSPFCILDEIDAALDDENIGRFINLLQEFSKDTQFLIITHNKRTITSANSLLGVTMEESGVSKIITTRLRENRN
jgi:chromosome segregation protein